MHHQAYPDVLSRRWFLSSMLNCVIFLGQFSISCGEEAPFCHMLFWTVPTSSSTQASRSPACPSHITSLACPCFPLSQTKGTHSNSSSQEPVCSISGNALKGTIPAEKLFLSWKKTQWVRPDLDWSSLQYTRRQVTRGSPISALIRGN